MTYAEALEARKRAYEAAADFNKQRNAHPARNYREVEALFDGSRAHSRAMSYADLNVRLAAICENRCPCCLRPNASNVSVEKWLELEQQRDGWDVPPAEYIDAFMQANWDAGAEQRAKR